MDVARQSSWPLWRALLTGVLAALLCMGVWILFGIKDPAPPLACGGAALLATTWAAVHSGSRGIFVLVICLISTLVVASMMGCLWMIAGAPFFFIGVLFFTIHGWMKNEGFI